MRWLLVVLVYCTLSAKAADSVVIGYLPYYRSHIIEFLPVEKLTDIVYFSLSPKADGSLDTSRVKSVEIQKLVKRAKQNNTRVHICVGGWELSGGFTSMTADPTARAIFIRNLITFIRTHKLQGADIDWEHPKTKKEVDNYQKLLVELKHAFAPHQLWLTVAVAGWGKYIKPETIPFIDRFHIMSYDQGTPHSSFTGTVKDLKQWENQKVPKSKLILGLPFYGRNKQGHALTYNEIMQKHQPKPDSDEADGFHFNGPVTITRKTTYAIQQGYGGVMIWELGQDVKGNASLLNTIQRAIQ